MKVLFNVMGPADRISKLIEALQTNGDKVLVDTFPTHNPILRDVNIEVEETEVDALDEIAEGLGLSPEMV